MSEEKTELEVLKERARTVGISFHPNIGLEKLKDKLNAKLNDSPEKPLEELTEAPTAKETRPARLRRLKREAKALVRVNIMNMNPSKKDWEGEAITTGNAVIGTVSRYIPFGTEDGWHVERCLLNVLEERKCQIFRTVSNAQGRKERKGKLINEFAVEYLEPLTKEELSALAAKQQAKRTIED